MSDPLPPCTGCGARVGVNRERGLCLRCLVKGPQASSRPRSGGPIPLQRTLATYRAELAARGLRVVPRALAVEVPAPAESPWTLDVLGHPSIAFALHGTPGPQGSKSFKGRNRAGRGVLVESSKKVKPWRQRVVQAATAAVPAGWVALNGPLVVDLVFTLERGRTLPYWLDWHERRPDLSKLARSTEDALTDARVWADDAKVADYRRLAKRFVGSDDPDALDEPGAVIRVWRVPAPMMEARRRRTRSGRPRVLVRQ